MPDKQHRKFSYIKPRFCGIARPEYTFFFHAHAFKTASEVLNSKEFYQTAGKKKKSYRNSNKILAKPTNCKCSQTEDMVVNKSPKDLLPTESLTVFCRKHGQPSFSFMFSFLLSALL